MLVFSPEQEDRGKLQLSKHLPGCGMKESNMKCNYAASCAVEAERGADAMLKQLYVKVSSSPMIQQG
jgi:hypothetical protein